MQCEILFHEFKMNATESTKMVVFKLSKNVVEKDHKGIGEELGGPGAMGAGSKYDKGDNAKKPRSRKGEQSIRQTEDGSLQSVDGHAPESHRYHESDHRQ